MKPPILRMGANQQVWPPMRRGVTARHRMPPTSSSDDGGRYRQASTAVVFHPSSQPKKETTHG